MRTAGWQFSNVARAAKPDACPACGRTVLVGLDADTCALSAVIDPTPIRDPRIEGQLLLAGRETYDLRGTSLRLTIERRRTHHYGRDYPCYRSHSCGETPLSRTQTTTPRIATPSPDSPPPF